MRRVRALALIGAALLLGGADEPQLVPDTSIRELRIEYSFRGAELLLYGAILHPGGLSPKGGADVIVVVRGPTEPILLREKRRVAGMWMNADQRRFASAPSFYAIASSKPVAELVDARTAAIYELGLDQLQLSPASAATGPRERVFEAGLRDLKRAQGLYVDHPRGVEISEGVLYRALIALPSRVPVGTYTADTFLIARGKVVASASREIEVGKAGFERFVALAARNHGLAYGLFAVLLSLGLGWLAARLFARRA